MSNGISHLGESSEKKFRRITGAHRPESASFGDAKLATGKYAEIKKASTPTCNQMRPSKGIPHVIDDVCAQKWLVISPERLIRDAATKRRGQHGESPFENCTASTYNYGDCAVAEEDLRATVRDVIRNFELEHSDLAEIMRRHVKNLRAETDRAIAEVLRYFEDKELDGYQDSAGRQSEAVV